MSLILGINSHHPDASACILRAGHLIAAVEEERLRRVKHWTGFPAQAIAYCLKEAGATLSDIDYLAVNTSPTAFVWKKFLYAVSRPADYAFMLQRWRRLHKRLSIEEELTQANLPGRFRGLLKFVEHHRAHLASAFYASPFTEANVVSVDGFGDFTSTAWGLGTRDEIDIQGRIHFPHSLGIFYQALTQYLGFPNYGDEYKLMGLAASGEPKFIEPLRRVLLLSDDGKFTLNRHYFCHHRKHVEQIEADGVPYFRSLYTNHLIDLLGAERKPGEAIERRHLDIARSVQTIYEEAFLNLLRSIHSRDGSDCIALAGGCAMNSVANGKIARQTPFRQVYVQPAAGDAGGALGAALQIAINHDKPSHITTVRRPGTANPNRMTSVSTVMEHAYWGPQAATDEIVQLLNQFAAELSEHNCAIECFNSEQQLCQAAAQRLANGEVLGWFQGRMEWGPRALGNRSILCDPRNPDIRSYLNDKIKRRESFRPFAPSILREHVSDWFEEDGDVPFMTQVFQIREDKQHLIPAVTHVDGSGRLQTVDRTLNSRFGLLIQEFFELTGIPMLLNTSFNENEPIVCTPLEALDCFIRTKMDTLVLANFVVSRNRK